MPPFLIPNESFFIYVRRGLWALLKTRSDFKAIVGNAGSSASYRLTTNSINPPSASASGVFRNRGSVHRPGPLAQIRSSETRRTTLFASSTASGRSCQNHDATRQPRFSPGTWCPELPPEAPVCPSTHVSNHYERSRRQGREVNSEAKPAFTPASSVVCRRGNVDGFLPTDSAEDPKKLVRDHFVLDSFSEAI